MREKWRLNFPLFFLFSSSFHYPPLPSSILLCLCYLPDFLFCHSFLPSSFISSLYSLSFLSFLSYSFLLFLSLLFLFCSSLISAFLFYNFFPSFLIFLSNLLLFPFPSSLFPSVWYFSLPSLIFFSSFFVFSYSSFYPFCFFPFLRFSLLFSHFLFLGSSFINISRSLLPSILLLLFFLPYLYFVYHHPPLSLFLIYCVFLFFLFSLLPSLAFLSSFILASFLSPFLFINIPSLPSIPYPPLSIHPVLLSPSLPSLSLPILPLFSLLLPFIPR